ncbi:MAG: VWA domain-containing protein [bacterium]
MTFASPWFFVLLLFLPLMALRLAGKKPSGMAFPDTAHVAKAAGRVSDGRFLLGCLRILAAALIITALARPQWGEVIGETSTRGIDIILCLDTSGSMQTVDVSPDRQGTLTGKELEKMRNRVDAAKVVAADFIRGRKNDRIGLVVFAGVSYTQCPLTIDHRALLELLLKVKAMMTGTDGTAIGNALVTSTNRLKKSDGKSRVIILLTDGRNNMGEVDPLTAARATNALGIKIYAIGCGSSGGSFIPVETLFGMHWQPIREDLDEVALRKIADLTGGTYFKAEDEESLAGIFKQIDRMEKREIKTTVIKRYLERYAWLLLPAFLLLAFETLLGHTILRRIP